MYNSPQPIVDIFVILKEAPLKILAGINPYDTTYTQVYSNSILNYFGYLPLSFIITMPFVIVFSDPRYATIFFNLLSVLLLYKLLKGKKHKDINIFIATFLMLPRSFYILEHMFLDQIIFSFFLLFFYFLHKKNYKLSVLSLSLFFGFKQYLFLIIPFVLKFYYKVILKYWIYFLLPFGLILLFFLINPSSFITDIVLNFNPAKKLLPNSLSLSFPNLLKILIPYQLAIYLSLFIFGLNYLLSFMFKAKKVFVLQIYELLFLFNVFSLYSYFNHYFLTFEFLLLFIIIKYFNLKTESTF